MGGGDPSKEALGIPIPLNEPSLTVKTVIAQMVEESRRFSIQSNNKMIIVRINQLGLRPVRGGA